jgi:hypothetical protein
MEYRPSHPDEPVLHHALRDALNRELKNKDFFVWVTVEPTGEAKEFENLDGIVAGTEAWLDRLNPDAVEEKALPKYEIEQPAATVQITALPRKAEVRDHRAGQIVANPNPIMVGWNE